MEDLNLFIFKGLRPEFKDHTTTLNALPEHVSFYDLQALFRDHEFINENYIAPLIAHLSAMQPFGGSYSQSSVSLGGATASLGQTSDLPSSGFDLGISLSGPFAGASVLRLPHSPVAFGPIH